MSERIRLPRLIDQMMNFQIAGRDQILLVHRIAEPPPEKILFGSSCRRSPEVILLSWQRIGQLARCQLLSDCSARISNNAWMNSSGLFGGSINMVIARCTRERRPPAPRQTLNPLPRHIR